MSGVHLTPQEAAALARYIAKHGIPYGPDDGLIESIANKLQKEKPDGRNA